MLIIQTAERVIATLRAHEEELRQAGLRSLSLFGSVARGETEMDSDIDLAAEFDPAARMDLLQLLFACGDRFCGGCMPTIMGHHPVTCRTQSAKDAMVGNMINPNIKPTKPASPRYQWVSCSSPVAKP
jgi:hypothetical protein